MNKDLTDDYNKIREYGETGFYEQKRGLIAVWGKESVQFLNGLITNDVARLESYAWMNAAFPNAQGRLLGKVRVMRFDEKFIFETEESTHEKIFNNLFRFTFAGDFFVEDLTDKYSMISVFAAKIENFKYKIPKENEIIGILAGEENGFLVSNLHAENFDAFLPKSETKEFIEALQPAVAISDELYEILRIENGIPLYGKDMDETTIIPELGIDGLISYNKGCYIGQEIIARIYFRGHVAKQLRGLIFDDETVDVNPQDELKTIEGKNAGKITSVTFSPKLGKKIALGFVRYDYLADETELKIGESTAGVKNLPFLQ